MFRDQQGDELLHTDIRFVEMAEKLVDALITACKPQPPFEIDPANVIGEGDVFTTDYRGVSISTTRRGKNWVTHAEVYKDGMTYVRGARLPNKDEAMASIKFDIDKILGGEV